MTILCCPQSAYPPERKHIRYASWSSVSVAAFCFGVLHGETYVFFCDASLIPLGDQIAMTYCIPFPKKTGERHGRDYVFHKGLAQSDPNSSVSAHGKVRVGARG